MNVINLLLSKAFVLVLLFGATFLSTFYLVLSLFPNPIQMKIKKRLGVVLGSDETQTEALLKWFKPFYSQVATLLYPNFAPTWWLNLLEKQKRKIQDQLTTANLRDQITPDELMALSLVMAFFITILGAMFVKALEVQSSFVVYLMLMAFGFFYPMLWVKEKNRIRQKEILRHLPYTIDLLTLSVESGLDFIAAISRLVVKGKRNTLIKELEIVLREIRLGVSRSDALRNLSQRLRIDQVTSLCTLLIQAGDLGVPIGQVLRAQSEELRNKRFLMAQIAGARASQIILFPLIFCILPAAMLVLLGPTIISFLKGGFF